jgi:hypothetical protein
MKCMTLFKLSISKCEASGEPEATNRNRICIQIGRVSAAEHLQGAFGQKAALSALGP